jgi:EmrB/QacA subfamily drug resistance transporter
VASKWWTLVVVCTAIFMLLLDITVVNVALPDIETDLHAAFTDLQWVVDAYALGLATCVLSAGTLADLLGRRRVFAVGLVLFSAASLACGLAAGPLSLIIARGAQGLGGAAMFACSLALLTDSFEGRERGTAFGIWGATTGAATAVGPMVGGVLVSGIGWRWIFFVNIPIGAVALALTFWRVRESRDPGARSFDVCGLATLSATLFLLVFGLLEANRRGWTDAVVLGCLAGSAAMLAVFVAIERAQERPMLDLSLFRRPAFAGAQIVAFALSAAAFSLFLYLTLYLQNVLGYSALEAGLRLLPVSGLAFLVAPVAGKLSSYAPPRIMLAVGLGLVAAGLALLTRLEPGSTWTVLLPGLVLLGAGVGCTNPPLASTAIAVAPQDRAGMASGTNNTFRQVGIATGIAALGTVFQHSIERKLTSGLQGTPLAARAGDLAGAVSSGSIAQLAARAPASVRDQVTETARSAFVTSLTGVFWIAAAVALAGALLALVLVRGVDIEQHGPPAEAASERDREVVAAAR